jgi:CRP/FNR family transcriptional regulator
MLCTFLDTPSPASAIAEEPVDALVMPAASFRRWIEESDSMREFVFQAIANRFIDLMMLVEEITFQKLDRRLAGFLLRSFHRKGLHLRELTATHEEIAMELGSAREVVSRLLKEFERLGAINIARGRITLQDANTLESIGRDPAVD